MNDKELIYWVDLTGPESIDEIVRLTIINTNNNVLFNHLFCPKVADYWDSDINGIEPEETYACLYFGVITRLFRPPMFNVA